MDEKITIYKLQQLLKKKEKKNDIVVYEVTWKNIWEHSKNTLFKDLHIKDLTFQTNKV